MASNLKIKYAMLQYGFSQEELGKLIGKDQSQVSRMLNGVEVPAEESKEIINKMKKARGE